jgi:hypothetical protein
MIKISSMLAMVRQYFGQPMNDGPQKLHAGYLVEGLELFIREAAYTTNDAISLVRSSDYKSPQMGKILSQFHPCPIFTTYSHKIYLMLASHLLLGFPTARLRRDSLQNVRKHSLSPPS